MELFDQLLHTQQRQAYIHKITRIFHGIGLVDTDWPGQSNRKISPAPAAPSVDFSLRGYGASQSDIQGLVGAKYHTRTPRGQATRSIVCCWFSVQPAAHTHTTLKPAAQLRCGQKLAALTHTALYNILLRYIPVKDTICLPPIRRIAFVYPPSSSSEVTIKVSPSPLRFRPLLSQHTSKHHLLSLWTSLSEQVRECVAERFPPL